MYPHLEEEIGNAEFELIDVFFLLVAVIVVIAFNLLVVISVAPNCSG